MYGYDFQYVLIADTDICRLLFLFALLFGSLY